MTWSVSHGWRYIFQLLFNFVQVRAWFTLYFLEQLMYATTLLQDAVNAHLSLLLIDILVVSLDCGIALQDNDIFEKCKQTLHISDNKCSLVLREKYDSMKDSKTDI